MRKRLLSIITAAVLLLSLAAPATAYELAPSARFDESAISDGELTVCYGTQTNQGLFINRSAIANYLKDTWGTDGYGGLTFSSNGVCDNDGSNIKIIWDREVSCASDPVGEVNSGPFEWTEIRVNMNADCEIQGLFDWSCNNPLTSDGNYTSAGKNCIHEWIMHEVGHTLGLTHPSGTITFEEIYSGMFYSPGYCWESGVSRGIGRDDIAGLKDEYDHTGFTWVQNLNPSAVPVAPICWD